MYFYFTHFILRDIMSQLFKFIKTNLLQEFYEKKKEYFSEKLIRRDAITFRRNLN